MALRKAALRVSDVAVRALALRRRTMLITPV
jgi:hypothetical protein